MSSVAPRERLDHDTTFPRAAALVLMLAAAIAPWHAPSAQPAVPCTAIENDVERLACYDRALRGAPAAAPAAAPAEPPVRRAPREAAAPSPPAAPAAAPASAPEPPVRDRRIRESTAPAAPAAPVAGRDDDAEIVPIVIVGVRTLQGRETTFTAEDGSIWVQTDSQRILRLPDPPFTAELKSGAMGSRFLVPEGRTRAIRVRSAR
jgi:hypothetical protein